MSLLYVDLSMSIFSDIPGQRCRNVIYAMLHPDSESRITAAEVLRSEWALGVAVCEVGETG